MKSECNYHEEIEFADVKIADTTSKLEDELNEFYHVKLEHQKKLAKIQYLGNFQSNNITRAADNQNKYTYRCSYQGQKVRSIRGW